MADLQANIDRVSRAFADAVTAGKFRLADRIAGLVERGESAADVQQAIAGLDVDDLLTASGLRADIDELGRAYAGQVLSVMQQFAPVSPEVLAALVEADKARYLQVVQGEIADLVRGIQRTILTGGDARAIRAVASQGISRAQVETLVNTSMNTFSRTVTALQAQQAPAEALYVYAGPVDGRTRDLCLKLAAAGELTRDEIERLAPGSFRDGGGFNCRHQWLPVGTVARRYQSQAQDAIAARGTKWTDPPSFQQQLEARDAAAE